MIAPNIPNTPKILRIEEIVERLELAEPAVVVSDSTFGESLTVRAGGHTITLTGHDFYIPFLSLAPNGRLEFNYDGEDYSRDVLGNMNVTFTGDNGVEFTDAA